MTMGATGAQIAQETISELSSGQNITELRQQLTDAVLAMANTKTNPYKRIIVYVDDLDRIEPRNAVAILELLKNIFSIPNCIFVLAIDYQVIVKGLAEKFGPPTPENEWEFKAFFDKIIQLPFMMPLGQYDIGNYVNNLLQEINFADGEDFDTESLANIVSYTIGGNPRSIKRLANSASLILLFSKIREEGLRETINEATDFGFPKDVDEKMLLFCILCLQIAYPRIYSLLSINPDFSAWDESFAFSITKKKEETYATFKEEFENAIKTEDFDEEWEKAIFRLCYLTPGLRNRCSDISLFFTYIKDEIFRDYQDSIGHGVAAVLTRTSVTSVTSDNDTHPNQKTKARSVLDGGLDEYGKSRKWTDEELDGMKRLKAGLEQGDPDLVFKVTKTQISISNKNTSSRSKVIFYCPSIVKGSIKIGMVGRQTEPKTIEMLESLNEASGIEIRKNSKDELYIELSVRFTQEDLQVILECIGEYKSKFHAPSTLL